MGHKPPKTGNHPVDVHVGQRIHRFREIRNMSARELAQPLGLSYQQIQKYERGANRIAASTLFEMTNLLQVPISLVFEGLPHCAPALPTAPEGPVADLLRVPDGAQLVEAILELPPRSRARLLTFLRALQPDTGA